MIETSTIELLNLIRNAELYNDSQELINMYVIELVNRIYIPFNEEQSYEEMLIKFGYKPIEKRKRFKK